MTRPLAIFFIFLASLSSLSLNCARAETPYPELELKASRFFDQKEWASASAMYLLMLDRKPGVASTYGRAIVAEGMGGHTQAQQRLLSAAMDHSVAFDSLFTSVRSTAFSIGNAGLYERFLTDAAETLPWARRNIYAHLLDFYLSRGNGPKTIELARTMLRGMPDNAAFLLALARGEMLAGQEAQAVDTLRELLARHPDSLDGLLYLANTLMADGQRSEARTLFERAYAIAPTPHLAATLEALGAGD